MHRAPFAAIPRVQGVLKLTAVIVLDGFDDCWETATGLTGHVSVASDVAAACVAHIGRLHAAGWGRQDSADFAIPAGNAMMGLMNNFVRSYPCNNKGVQKAFFR